MPGQTHNKSGNVSRASRGEHDSAGCIHWTVRGGTAGASRTIQALVRCASRRLARSTATLHGPTNCLRYSLKLYGRVRLERVHSFFFSVGGGGGGGGGGGCCFQFSSCVEVRQSADIEGRPATAREHRSKEQEKAELREGHWGHAPRRQSLVHLPARSSVDCATAHGSPTLVAS